MSVTRELRLRVPPDRSLRPFEPCLPRAAKQPPAGPGWIHEIKHDGFRILARRDANGVRLSTRNGYNFADRFPMIVAALKTCLYDHASSTAKRSLLIEPGCLYLTCSATGNMTAPPFSARSI